MIKTKPKNGCGYIYKYTAPSGKSYIGQTIVSLYQRAGGLHGKHYRKCPYFYHAILKYGFENFSCEILAEAPIEQLNELEKKYIILFNTLIPNGYNILEGGADRRRQMIYQYDMVTGQFIQSYESVAEAGLAVNREPQSISDCLYGRKLTCGGYCWSKILLNKYPVKEKSEILTYDSTEKQVFMYDLQGHLIQTFVSISAAAAYCGGERSAIKRCCRHELNSHCGYRWECSEVLAEKKYNNTAKAVKQIDKETNEIIKIHSSISAAARAVNGSNSGIRRVLNRDNRTAYGYKWQESQSSTTINS